MRVIILLIVLGVGVCLPVGQAWAQAPSAAQAAKPAVSDSATELSRRPDANRYYWHNGQWWYYTQQSTWLRWNGNAWVTHHSLNDNGAMNPAVAQPYVQPQGVDSGANTYRFQINRRRGGL